MGTCTRLLTTQGDSVVGIASGLLHINAVEMIVLFCIRTYYSRNVSYIHDMWTSWEKKVQFEENYISLDIQRVDPPWS